MSPPIKTRLRARDVMTPEPICVESGAPIEEAARLLEESGISGAPVMDASGRVIGVISKTDIIERFLQAPGPERPPAYLYELLSEEMDDEFNVEERIPINVDEFMSEDPITASPDEPLSALARRMVEQRVHRVIVVDQQGFPVGVVTTLDMLKAMSD